MIRVKTTGLDQLQKNLKALEGTQEVPIGKLFPPEFMRRHTNYGSFEEMLDASPFEVESADDFKAIPDREWDEFVQAGSSFSSWAAMMKEAAGAYAQAMLSRGLS